MKKKAMHVLIGVFSGMVILTAGVWPLSKTLGNAPYSALYEGKSFDYWQRQLNGQDAAVSNPAFLTVRFQPISRLVDTRPVLEIIFG